MDYAADHAAVVDVMLAPRVGLQMRLDPQELLVREPEKIAIDNDSLAEAVNHMVTRPPTDLWVETLVERSTKRIFTAEFARQALTPPDQSLTDFRSMFLP
jgi:hypothetical protein